MNAPDWIERKTAELLARAKRSPYFANVIADAEYIERTTGQVWDVCLAQSVAYWCFPLPPCFYNQSPLPIDQEH